MTIYTANGPGKSVGTKTFNKNNKKTDICLSMLTGVQNKPVVQLLTKSTGIEK